MPFRDSVGHRRLLAVLVRSVQRGSLPPSLIFGGPEGIGKRHVAIALAQLVNCLEPIVDGEFVLDACGACPACRRIARGMHPDVIVVEPGDSGAIKVDQVRDLVDRAGYRPFEGRRRVVIINQADALVAQAQNALLKTLEEPPPHVVFMMATTELEKVPATIQSRSQVFELKTIGVKQIADQLQTIAAAEGIQLDNGALTLLARAGDGSMRDAQSAFDQVIAFAGTTITADDVTTVLGLVRRDLLMEIAEAVAREDSAALFELAAQAVESGYDMRHVIRELARLTRDLLVVGLDPARLNDPEIAAENERDRIKALAGQFSNEDLMRAFDVLTKADYDIRGSTQPRYHLELALLRWVHLRRLVPLTDLIQGLDTGSATAPRVAAPRVSAAPVASKPAVKPPSSNAATVRAVETRRAEATVAKAEAEPPPPAPAAPAPAPTAAAAPSGIKDALLAEMQKSKKFFYGTVVAQAQRIEIEGDRVVMAFAPQHRALKQQLEQSRPWLEEMASRLAGRKMTVIGVDGTGVVPPKAGEAARGASGASEGDQQAALKQKAMADSGVQAMLDVFRTDIKEVEEI
jgi:DNA polymerase-3 subunit gamma/tau